MQTTQYQDANTKTSTRCCEQVAETCDDEINAAYNLFHAESMKHYRGVIIRLNKNFRRRKTASPYEWSNFKNVIDLCKKYGFNLKIYIKYCFLNRLVPHGKGRILSDITYLTHFQQISSYAKKRNEIDRNYAIYMNILKTVMFIRGIHKKTGLSIPRVLKGLFSSGNFADYVMSGRISKFFLALIPNAENVIHEETKNSDSEERHVIDGLCSSLQELRPKASDSMSMFWPDVLKKSIVEICSER